ncbi:ATP-dependent DNA helicase Q4 isoform X2 [Thalassophryne amazonica]|uniref:ATP-dependent DNA helicase Q4 isoform X2 n=1 Tax=Thalassophryne amazonica TaxID=390379 RepID=UPI001471E17A|nr:ATP-dependent DNA helicase Q4 isoform X2 [Thalassophryne amazonica]
MDRYDKVKILLKNWEQSFVKEHQRKPTKDDIDQAPEETRNLYKEYRSLKQAREINSRSSGHTEQCRNTLEKAECWGAHLNRTSLPASSPTLTPLDKDKLKASAQYYGLKLKNNLSTLSKEHPVSLKKPFISGRTPVNLLKDRQAEKRGNPVSESPESVTHILSKYKSWPSHSKPFSQRVKSSDGSPSSQASHPTEPDEPFQPFEPASCDGSLNVAPSYSHNDAGTEGVITPGITCENLHIFNQDHSPVRSAALLSSLPSPRSEAGQRGDAARLNKTEGLSGDMKLNGIIFNGSLDPTGSGTLVGLRGSPQCVGGLGGGLEGRGIQGKPKVSRLTLLDRKWLERCQVFGEMGAEEKPGAGNQVTEGGRGKAEIEEKTETTGLTRNEESKSIIEDRIVSDDTPKLHRTRKSEGKEGMEMKEGKEKESQLVPQPMPHDGENGLKSKDTKRRGTKRLREEEVTEEERGVSKRQRKSKEREQSSDVNSKPAERGGRKKKSNKKNVEHEDTEEKETKVPEKAPQENLLGEIQEEFEAKSRHQSQPARFRSMKNAEGNFVKINLKKKSHVKGFALRGVALRKQMYMQKFQLKGERFGGGGSYYGRGRRGGFTGGFGRHGDTCYKCGGVGHWAVDCKGRAPPPPVCVDKPEEDKPFELPTLEEVARATGTLREQPLDHVKEDPQRQDRVDSSHKDDQLLNVIRPDYERPAPPPPMEPLYDLKDDGKVQGTPTEVYAALRELGYESFRQGQEEAIMRILSGLSTLVVLSTGMGKSLCYQLPAYLYAQRSKCITLVISPLVSLMDDQLSGLPAKLRAACIHSNMTMKQREATVEKVKSGQVCVLLLSPEALVGGGGSGSGCLPSAHELPPVAFACIDEAHCVSEWSHNFRPCYLRLCKVLRERLGVQCLLGLTATATLSTALDIARHLDISDQDGIAVRSAAVPPNLHLSVSMDREKDQALVSLLKGDRFGCLDSIIVYCTRREETVRVAALLRTCLQGVLVKENFQITDNSQTQSNPIGHRKKELARKKIRKPLKWQAESYHAGLSASERRRVQNNFMCGELRIVVATVAFGMGLDKSDVRGVIHYNMPKSFESYVQEIGRAGRDGGPAHCHLFLDPEGADLHELRRHIYADTVDYYTVKRLVQKVFPPCKCKLIHQRQQELHEDVEDSELLGVIDVCDRESTEEDMKQSTDQTLHTDVQTASAAKVLPPPNVDEASLQQNEKDRKEEGEKKKMPMGADSSIKHQDKHGMDTGDWMRDDGVESSDWPRERVCHTHERAIPIQQTLEALDITEEGVETLLCYLELHPQSFVELLHPTLSVCKISCYNGPRQLHKITKICPPVAVVLARKRMAGERVEVCDQLEFDVVEVADTMGWELPLVKRGLRQLQWSADRGGGRSGVHVEFSSPSFYFRSHGDLSDEEMDRVCRFLHNRVQEQERTQLYQLTACFKSFKSVAFRSVSSCLDALDEPRSLQLKNLLAEYFDRRRDRYLTLSLEDSEHLDKFKLCDFKDQIRADVRSFLSNRSDEKFSGRAVARIFHGIGSPCYPAQIYGKDRRYWRKYIQFDFNQLIRLATQEIIQFK